MKKITTTVETAPVELLREYALYVDNKIGCDEVPFDFVEWMQIELDNNSPIAELVQITTELYPSLYTLSYFHTDPIYGAFRAYWVKMDYGGIAVTTQNEHDATRYTEQELAPTLTMLERSGPANVTWETNPASNS